MFKYQSVRLTSSNELTAIGILGATVMPHALFLGSSLGTLDRVSTSSSLPANVVHTTESLYRRFVKYVRALFYFNSYTEEDAPDRTTRHEHRNNNSYEFVSAHLTHGTVDISKAVDMYPFFSLLKSFIHIVMSLSCFAIPINSA